MSGHSRDAGPATGNAISFPGKGRSSQLALSAVKPPNSFKDFSLSALLSGSSARLKWSHRKPCLSYHVCLDSSPDADEERPGSPPPSEAERDLCELSTTLPV